MGEHALISLDLESLESLQLQGLKREIIFIFGRVKINVSPKNYHEAISFIRQNIGSIRVFCDVVALDNVTDVISLLDNGAAKVFVSCSQLSEIMVNGFLADTDRLIVCVDGSHTTRDDADVIKSLQEDFMATGKPIQNFKLMDADSDSQKSTERLKKVLKGQSLLYVALANNTMDEYLWAVRSGFTPIISAQSLTAEPDKYPHLTPVHRLITGIIHSDRSDGLYPTVVTDEDGVCLGLVYSNEESIETALRLQRGVYHSRSRKGLWIKGEESGDIQQLVRIEWDCDGDALRFMVRQQGNGKSMVEDAWIFCRLQEQDSATLKVQLVSAPILGYHVFRKHYRPAKFRLQKGHTLLGYSKTPNYWKPK